MEAMCSDIVYSLIQYTCGALISWFPALLRCILAQLQRKRALGTAPRNRDIRWFIPDRRPAQNIAWRLKQPCIECSRGR